MAAKDLIAGGTIGPMIYQPSRLFHCHSPGTTRLCRPLIKLLDPSLPRTRTGRIWTYVGDRDHPYTVYDYTPTRSRDGPDSFMKEFHGYLQADAYSGYDELYRNRNRNITEVACWAHVRRRHFEAQSSDLMRSTVILAYIRLLYDVEREARSLGLTGGTRKALRQAKSAPILEDIKAYIEREQPAVLPKSPEGMAMAYTLSNWDALARYCDDGDLEIDNNGAERSLRGIAVGRENWNFYGNNAGGNTAAVLTSITVCVRGLFHVIRHSGSHSWMEGFRDRVNACWQRMHASYSE